MASSHAGVMVARFIFLVATIISGSISAVGQERSAHEGASSSSSSSSSSSPPPPSSSPPPPPSPPSESAASMADACDVLRMVPYTYLQHKAPEPSAYSRRSIQEAKKRNRQKAIKNFESSYSASDVQFPVIGRHRVAVNVTFSDDSATCFLVEYEIANTDECGLSLEADFGGDVRRFEQWRPKCDASALCVDVATADRYHCTCPAGQFGRVGSGSVHAPSSPKYSGSPGICHGYGDSQKCCSVDEVRRYSESAASAATSAASSSAELSRNLECNSAHCMENCKVDFICAAPCDAIWNSSASQFPDNDDQGNAVAKAKGKGVTCDAIDASASFRVQCADGYHDPEHEEGHAVAYEWVDRMDPSGHGDGASYSPPPAHADLPHCVEKKQRLFCEELRYRHECPCNCECRDADPAAGFHPEGANTLFYCEPMAGFIAVDSRAYGKHLKGLPAHPSNHRGDANVCLDQDHPEIVLVEKSRPRYASAPTSAADGAYEFRQGDRAYDDEGFLIRDDNHEDQLDRLFSTRPAVELAGDEDGFLVDTGVFTINYTITTPWLPNPVTQAQRVVRVLDVDECSYPADAFGLEEGSDGGAVASERFRAACFERDPESDPHFIFASATCVNIEAAAGTAGAGYACTCPDGYETGNGFSTEAAAQRFADAATEEQKDAFYGHGAAFDAAQTYCRDSAPPTITLLKNDLEYETANTQAVLIDPASSSVAVSDEQVAAGNSEEEFCNWDYVTSLVEKVLVSSCGPNFSTCVVGRDHYLARDGQVGERPKLDVSLVGVTLVAATDGTAEMPVRCSQNGVLKGPSSPGKFGDEEAATRTPTHLVYAATFSTTDPVGLSVVQNMSIKIKPIDLAQLARDDRPTSRASKPWILPSIELPSLPSFTASTSLVYIAATIIGFLALSSTLTSVMLIGQSLVKVAQLLLFPDSIVHDRPGFELGYSFLLSVLSFRTFWGWSDHEVMAKVDMEWQRLSMNREWPTTKQVWRRIGRVSGVVLVLLLAVQGGRAVVHRTRSWAVAKELHPSSASESSVGPLESWFPSPGELNLTNGGGSGEESGSTLEERTEVEVEVEVESIESTLEERTEVDVEVEVESIEVSSEEEEEEEEEEEPWTTEQIIKAFQEDEKDEVEESSVAKDAGGGEGEGEELFEEKYHEEAEREAATEATTALEEHEIDFSSLVHRGYPREIFDALDLNQDGTFKAPEVPSDFISKIENCKGANVRKDGELQYGEITSCLKVICNSEAQLLGLCPTLFTALDTNDDLKLSAREVNPNTVSKLDANRDRTVSAGEMAEVLFSATSVEEALALRLIESLHGPEEFSRLLEDDQMPHYLLAHLVAMWQFFAALDDNSDGMLDIGEIPLEKVKEIEALSHSKDNLVSFPELAMLIEARCSNEYRVNGKCITPFHLFDANSNRQLDDDEVDESIIERLDVNGDGVIGSDEMADVVYESRF